MRRFLEIGLLQNEKIPYGSFSQKLVHTEFQNEKQCVPSRCDFWFNNGLVVVNN